MFFKVMERFAVNPTLSTMNLSFTCQNWFKVILKGLDNAVAQVDDFSALQAFLNVQNSYLLTIFMYRVMGNTWS